MATGKRQKNSIAIFAVTSSGVEIGRRLKILLPDSHLYLPDKLSSTAENESAFSSSLGSSVQKAFGVYGYMVLIMATGIAVRLLAPVLKDKLHDPGVVVVDASGKHVISLLSGHAGGANDLTQKVAACLGAEPVITTASDLMGTINADIFGREFGWKIEDDDKLSEVIADIVDGKPIGICQETGETQWRTLPTGLPGNIRIFSSIRAMAREKPAAALLISDRIPGQKELVLLPENTVIYRPPSLVIGIGCNRGASAEEIEEVVATVFSRHGLSVKSIRNLATIDKKQDEPGLLEFARKNGLKIDYFDRDQLSNAKFPSPASDAAQKHVGTPSVCESAALLSSRGRIIVPKASYKRVVTVAVARVDFNKEARPRGKVYIIGIGPGDSDQLTLSARALMDRCDVIVGYKTYIKLIKRLLSSNKEILTSGMGDEVERARQAIELAKLGKTVAVVSSGDAGIYGMAGIVAEIVAERSENTVDLEVVPGVPAFVAASAVLGAPLMNDFVSISLSDHLVAWKDIQTRLKLAAQGDFSIVLYNPRSRQRPTQLNGAREIIRKYRASTTPVGIVTNAFREGQQSIITDLVHMMDYDIGMNTVIIIGNSQTFVDGGRMITRRGYQAKYVL